MAAPRVSAGSTPEEQSHATNPRPDLFREVITEDQATVTAFAVDQLVQIQDYVSAELEYAGLSQTGPLTPSLSSKAHAQLLQHGEALREDADQLARLQLYLRVNDEAVRRLQQKVDRLPAVFAGLDLSSDWRAETAPLRTALASLLAATNCAAASISAALRAGTPKTSGLASQAATLQEQRRPVRYDTPDQPPGTPAGGPPPLHLAVMAAEVKGDGDDGCDVLRRLLAASPRAVDEVDAGAGAADRTPLAIAAIYGRERAAKVLLDAGADTRLQDRFGWTALENAAYRGFPKIVELIQAADARAGKKEGGQVARAHSPAVAAMLRALDAPELDISAGHIFVYPGTLDLNRDVEAVDVAPYRARIAPGVLPDTSLRLAVTATNCGGQRYETDLPLLGDAWTDPWHFTARDVDQAALSFELSALATVAQSLHPAGDDTTAKSGDATGAETLQFERIATAITTLGALRQTSGVLPGFESLVRDHTLPLVGTDGCLVGTVAFSVVATTPMPAAAPPPPFPPQRLDRPAKTLVVGHRGAGQNTPQRYLQLGENTVESFRAAVGHDKLAAAGVEFDVQLTKDFHPVVYHDFLVAETGADTPVHNLTLAQFLAVNDRQKATGPGGVAQTPSMPSDLMARPNETGRRRAHSLGGTVETDTETLIRGMQRTFPYRGFKANLRTEQIHQPFATFEEVLKGLPEDIVFDVEISMCPSLPLLHSRGEY